MLSRPQQQQQQQRQRRRSNAVCRMNCLHSRATTTALQPHHRTHQRRPQQIHRPRVRARQTRSASHAPLSWKTRMLLGGVCAALVGPTATAQLAYDVVTADRFVGPEGYETRWEHTQQGIAVFPVIAYTNENGYELESAVGENEYSWTTCDAEIYSFLPTSVTPLQECYEACRYTTNCTNFRYVTEFPAVNVFGDQDGIRPDENVTTLAEVSKAEVTQQCELHSSCEKTRTAAYPGTTYRLLTVDNSCLDTCLGFSCDYYAEQGYSCELMETISDHCDCSGCKCERHWQNQLESWNLGIETTTPWPTTTGAPSSTTAASSSGEGDGGDEPSLYVCTGFWDRPRDYDDPDCNGNTWPFAQTPSGGDYNFEICPGFNPGFVFLSEALNETTAEEEERRGRRFRCNGTAAECAAFVTCDVAAGYTGSANITCPEPGAKFETSGCSRNDIVARSGNIFRYFTHLDCSGPNSEGNLAVIGLSTVGNPSGKNYSRISANDCAEECNDWTRAHPENPCKAISMGNGACKSNNCEKISPDMCYNHCSDNQRCVLKNYTYCQERLTRDPTYDMWWILEDKSLFGYDQCYYRWTGGGEDEHTFNGESPAIHGSGGGRNSQLKFGGGADGDFGGRGNGPMFGTQMGRMDCSRQYLDDDMQDRYSRDTRSMNFGVWDPDGT